MTEKHHISPETAPKALAWLKDRGGLAIWKSINLSNPGASWSTPATILCRDCQGPPPEAYQRLCPIHLKPVEKAVTACGKWFCMACGQPYEDERCAVAYPKPNWQVGNQPDRVITDPADIVVDVPGVYRRFKVAVRVSGNGTMLKLTDHSSMKLRGVVQKCVAKHRSGWYEFDHETQEAVVSYAAKEVPLTEWKPEEKP